MTAKVIAWPPVGAVGVEWTEVAPVQVSRSLITGAERVSAFQRKRRMATITVPGVGRSTYDGGYMEMLKRYLAGVNLVRLYSYPVAWHFDRPERIMVRGTVYTHLGQTWVDVSGLKPNTEVCRPGDFLTLFITPASSTPTGSLPWTNEGDPVDWFMDDASSPDSLTWFAGSPDLGTAVQVTRPVVSDDTGRASVPVFETITSNSGFGGDILNSLLGVGTNIYVLFGSSDTGVFRPMSYPRAVQPQMGNWAYEWQFREVFADEVGGFLEVDPWRP